MADLLIPKGDAQDNDSSSFPNSRSISPLSDADARSVTADERRSFTTNINESTARVLSACNLVLDNEPAESMTSPQSSSDRTATQRPPESAEAARERRIGDTVQAIRDLPDNSNKWYVIRDRLVREYESGGPNAAQAERNLTGFISEVNRRLGRDGGITFERLTGALAQGLAQGERMTNPDLVLGFRIRHTGGTLGPIGVCFKASPRN